MRSLILFIVASLIGGALLLLSVRNDIRNMQKDFQAYQSAPLMPDEFYKKELPR